MENTVGYGKSAYDLAVEKGYTGTIDEWLETLVGERGTDGKSAYDLAVEKGYTGTLEEWLESLVGKQGANGKSTYELAVEKGYTGTLEEWLESLVGEQGIDGKSAYDLAVEKGYTGTIDEWLESLVGKQGVDGKSAYDLAVENGYTGSKEEWLLSLNGNDGKSAFELYKEKYDFNGTEEEWLELLFNSVFDKKSHTVTFEFNNGDDDLIVEVEHGEKIKRPSNPEKLGYNFVNWTCFDGVEDVEWSFIGYTVTENIVLEANYDYATYELPIINIDTNDQGIYSKEDYVDMTFSLENCADELFEVTGGIRLRGNSTKAYPKKPYRIKFDKKQSIFGLAKAKSWVLLADYLDPSALHNHAALTLGNQLPGLEFTATPNKVNVYLNGEYIGLYTLCEQIQENEGRMNIELDEITEEMSSLKDFNFFISMDRSVATDSTAVLDETYFYIEEYNQYFELKYPEKDQFVSDEQFTKFFNELKAYIKEIMDAFANNDAEKIKKETNVNSLIDYLIIDQIMGEVDHQNKSFNMYYTSTSNNVDENNKLNFGPIWDYDFALYVGEFTGKPNQNYVVSDRVTFSNLFFKAMINTDEFYAIVKERYQLYAVNAVEDYLDELDNVVSSMSDSIMLNQKKWYYDYDENISKDNIDFLRAFLERRLIVLGNLWGKK